jgi:hypothetical protein
MTKAQIIQRLLDEKHITVEEAMTLMAQDPIPMPAPVNPYSPPYRVGDPDWTWDPNRNPIWYTTHTTSKPIFETSDNSDV